MDYFSILKDSDIFENPTVEPDDYMVRPTAKGIVVDYEGKIALLSNREHSLFPGGGVEDGESFEEAFIRECKEEIGCDVDIISHLGDALQFRAKNATKYDVHFFVGRVVDEKGAPTTTEEGELACVINWLTEEEVLKVLEEQMGAIHEDDYPAHFNCLTHLEVFKKYMKARTSSLEKDTNKRKSNHTHDY